MVSHFVFVASPQLCVTGVCPKSKVFITNFPFLFLSKSSATALYSDFPKLSMFNEVVSDRLVHYCLKNLLMKIVTIPTLDKATNFFSCQFYLIGSPVAAASDFLHILINFHIFLNFLN